MFRVFRVFLLLLPVLLVACKNQPSPPAAAPANFTATAGENRVVLSWDAVPGETYWVYYKAGSSVTTSDHDYIGKGVTSPAVITGSGLINGTQYAFMVAASNKNSKTGPATPVVTATPRLLGPAVSWTVGTPLSGNALNSVISNNNYFVAVGDAGTLFTAPYSYTSVGGVTGWSQATTPVGTATDLSSVLYNGSQFVVLGRDGSVISSSDQINWITRTAIVGAPLMNGLAYASGRGYVAVGANGAIYRNSSGSVTDGWTAMSSGSVQDLYGVSYVNGLFVAVGAAGTLLTSADGITWTAQTSNTNSSLRHVAYGAATYVAVGDAGAVVSSTDAATWTSQAIPTTESFYSICFGPDLQFIAVGTTGTLAYSTTGLDGSWSVANATSLDLHSIAPGNIFIAVGAAGTNVSGK